jgi:lysosomal acid lipase/cholesteryl ester hydrolase
LPGYLTLQNNWLELEPSSPLTINPDAFKSFADLVFEQGLNFEQKMVKTSDGYHLQLFRIWDKTKTGPPVFLQHGLFSSADTWIMNTHKSPAFVLAKQGYDVWLGNNRGNNYSRGHDTLDPNKDFKKYFDFSFFELGKYDAPA